MAKHCHQRIGDYKMALTRTILEAMGIEEKKIDEIISAHAETMSALKQQRDSYKAQADELAEVQRKLDEANETIKANDSDAWKVKYDAIKEEYDNYKSDISAKETTRAKQAAYREVLKAAGVSEKRIDSIIRVSDIDSVELDESGKIKEADKLTESIKNEWADFIVSTNTQGANTATQQTTSKKSFSREDIDKMTPDEINKNWETIKNSLKGDR